MQVLITSKIFNMYGVNEISFTSIWTIIKNIAIFFKLIIMNIRFIEKKIDGNFF